ncbi:MAG: NAD(P)-binding domain-containing protein, partial [Planctomycetota bacterium]
MAKKTLTLQQKIDSRKVVVGILGLGYVGLPLAREFATSGIKVLGFDIDDKKIKKLNAGKTIIKGVPNATIKKMIADKKFSATTNMSRMK